MSTVVQSHREIGYYSSSRYRFHIGGLPEFSSCLGAKLRSGGSNGAKKFETLDLDFNCNRGNTFSRHGGILLVFY